MRAHWPENSLLGMEEAVVAGVTTLEMDVVIGSDGQPLLSHEPWLSPEICRTPDGQPIAEGDRSWNLYTMPVENVARCDCGSLGHPRFPQQRPVPTTKPTLAQLFEALRDRAVADPRFAAVRFNIELKHRPEGDGIYHPAPIAMTYLWSVAHMAIIRLAGPDWHFSVRRQALPFWRARMSHATAAFMARADDVCFITRNSCCASGQ